jgi:phosphinothricin acetyltransferase
MTEAAKMSSPIAIRPGTLHDLPAITELINYYIVNTLITFDVTPYTVEQRVPWFHDHNDGKRYRLFVAEDNSGILGYAATGRFRPKEAYDTTAECSIACRHGATSRGIGKQLYATLFAALQDEDLHRLVAGITQPNDASNALHRSFGFKPIGAYSEVGRKFGKYWDVLWMERPLNIP